jgi:hypothetical protein
MSMFPLSLLQAKRRGQVHLITEGLTELLRHDLPPPRLVASGWMARGSSQGRRLSLGAPRYKTLQEDEPSRFRRSEWEAMAHSIAGSFANFKGDVAN